MDEEYTKSGIERAVEIAGKQVILAELVSSASGRNIVQGRISTWVGLGYVPKRGDAEIVARITGVPIDDLLPKRKRRTSPPHAGRRDPAA